MPGARATCGLWTLAVEKRKRWQAFCKSSTVVLTQIRIHAGRLAAFWNRLPSFKPKVYRLDPCISQPTRPQRQAESRTLVPQSPVVVCWMTPVHQIQRHRSDHCLLSLRVRRRSALRLPPPLSLLRRQFDRCRQCQSRPHPHRRPHMIHWL